MAGHSCLHEFTPLGTVLRTLPRRVEAEMVLLEVELNRSKPGSSWSTRWATPVHRQTTDGWLRNKYLITVATMGNDTVLY